MKKLFSLLLVGMFSLMLASCVTGQQRGITGSGYLSSSRPAIWISAPNLPCKAGGLGTGNLHHTSVLGGLTLDVQTAVFASDSKSPMAVIAHAELTPAWFWTSPQAKMGSINTSYEYIGEETYEAWTYLVPATKDPFGGLAGEDVSQETCYWIARHFEFITNFRRTKIVLEYREPLPAGLDKLEPLPFGQEKGIKAFEERARKAFKAGNVKEFTGTVTKASPQGIRWRYVNDEFLGPVMEDDSYLSR